MTKSRRGEIAHALLKAEAKEHPIHLGTLVQEVARRARAAGIEETEAQTYAREFYCEIIADILPIKT